MTILQMALIMLVFHRALRIPRNLEMDRTRSRSNSR